MFKRSPRNLRNWLGVVAIASTLGACVTTSDDESGVDANDPIEPVNRVIFATNGALDAVLLRPAASWYRDIAPPEVKKSAKNFVNNWKSPLTFLHDLAQLEDERAFIIAQRFMINTTIGVGGLFDVAGDLGVGPHHEEDAGQTLATYGVPDGPYLVLPIFGPSSLRDATGTAIDYFADPVSWGPRKLGEKDVGRALTMTRSGLNVLDKRASTLDTLDEVERTSLDYYAAVRSLYRQLRADAINNGQSKSMSGDLDDGLEDPEDASFDFDETTESAASE